MPLFVTPKRRPAPDTEHPDPYACPHDIPGCLYRGDHPREECFTKDHIERMLAWVDELRDRESI